ncbi:MAG: sodium/proline symporter [Planctomycetes bacterium]|nr:sodium/proline symporter [Planctomycetota bacterium]
MGDGLFNVIGVVVYLAVLLGIGAVASRRTKNLRDFVAAGKQLRFLSVAFSARATGESAWLLLGLTGLGAAVGVKAFWVVLGELLGVGCAWMLLARPFKRLTDRYDSLTIPDYLESRFRDSSHRLRLVAAISLMVFVSIYVSAQIDATGQAFEHFLGWNYFIGAAVGFLVVIIYTVGGGFLAVVWSDVFQGAMMFVGLVALPICGLIAIGGPGELTERLRAIDPSTLDPLTGVDGAVGVGALLALVCIGLGFCGSPQIFSRFLALRSEDEIVRGMTVAMIWTLFADSGAVVIGLCARALLGIADEGALAGLVEHLLPTFFVGLYIAVVLAAIMSTADSLLVVASSAVVRDVWQKMMRPDAGDAESLRLIRRWTIGIALVALVIAMSVAVLSPSRTVFWFVIFGWSGIAATFCPTMILSLFWRGMTARGAIAAMAVGFAGVPFFKFAAPTFAVVGPFFAALEELIPSFCLSGIVGIVVSLTDREGRIKMQDVGDELDAAR